MRPFTLFSRLRQLFRALTAKALAPKRQTQLLSLESLGDRIVPASFTYAMVPTAQGPFEAAVAPLPDGNSLAAWTTDVRTFEIVLLDPQSHVLRKQSFSCPDGFGASAMALAGFTPDGRACFVGGNDGPGVGKLAVFYADAHGNVSTPIWLNTPARPCVLLPGAVPSTTPGGIDSLLVITEGGDDEVLLTFDAQGQAQVSRLPLGLTSIKEAATLDFDADGRRDFVAVSGSTGEVLLFRGDWAGGFSRVGSLKVGAYGVSVTAWADGDITRLAVSTPAENSVSLIRVDRSGAMARTGSLGIPDYPSSVVAVPNLNGDGKTYLVVTQLYSGTVLLYPGTAAGEFGTPQALSGPSGARAPKRIDANSDGRPDLAYVAGLSNAVVIDYNLTLFPVSPPASPPPPPPTVSSPVPTTSAVGGSVSDPATAVLTASVGAGPEIDPQTAVSLATAPAQTAPAPEVEKPLPSLAAFKRNNSPAYESLFVRFTDLPTRTTIRIYGDQNNEYIGDAPMEGSGEYFLGIRHDFVSRVMTLRFTDPTGRVFATLTLHPYSLEDDNRTFFLGDADSVRGMRAFSAIGGGGVYDWEAAQLGTLPNMRQAFEVQVVSLSGLAPTESADALLRRGYPQLVGTSSFAENVRATQQDLDQALAHLQAAAAAAFFDALAPLAGRAVAQGDRVAEALSPTNRGVAWVLGMWGITADRVRWAVGSHVSDIYQAAVRLKGEETRTLDQVRESDILAAWLAQPDPNASVMDATRENVAAVSAQFGLPVPDGFLSQWGLEKIVTPAGDILSPMTPETLSRIRSAAEAARESARVRGDEETETSFDQLYKAADGLLRDPSSTQSAGWVATVERMTTDPVAGAVLYGPGWLNLLHNTVNWTATGTAPSVSNRLLRAIRDTWHDFSGGLIYLGQDVISNPMGTLEMISEGNLWVGAVMAFKAALKVQIDDSVLSDACKAQLKFVMDTVDFGRSLRDPDAHLLDQAIGAYQLHTDAKTQQELCPEAKVMLNRIEHYLKHVMNVATTPSGNR